MLGASPPRPPHHLGLSRDRREGVWLCFAGSCGRAPSWVSREGAPEPQGGGRPCHASPLSRRDSFFQPPESRLPRLRSEGGRHGCWAGLVTEPGSGREARLSLLHQSAPPPSHCLLLAYAGFGAQCCRGEYRGVDVTQPQSPRAAPRPGGEVRTVLVAGPGHRLQPRSPAPARRPVPSPAATLLPRLRTFATLSPLPGQLPVSLRVQLKQHLLWEALAPGIPHWFPSRLHTARLPFGAFSLCAPRACLPGSHTGSQAPVGRGKHVVPGVLPPQPQLSLQAGSWAERRGPRGGQGLLAPDRSALTPEGYALSGPRGDTDLGQPRSASFSSW